MVRQSLVTLATLGKPFAVKGWQYLHSHTSVPEKIFDYTPHLLLKTPDQLKPCVFAEYQLRSDAIVVRLEAIELREQAASLCQTDIVMAREHLPDTDDGYYWHDLIGLEVVHTDEQGRQYNYGTVDSIGSAGGRHDILQVSSSEQQVRLIPFIEDLYITEVDIQAGRIKVHWPPEY